MRFRSRYLPFDAAAAGFKGYQYASDPGVAWLAKEKMAPTPPSSGRGIHKKMKYIGPYSQEFYHGKAAPKRSATSAPDTGYKDGVGSGRKTHKKSKGVLVKKAKKVHVTKDFKQKVEKALAPKTIWGEVLTHQAGRKLTAGENVCSVTTFDQQFANSAWLWTSDVFLHWASVLWNSKTGAVPTAATQVFGVGGVSTVGNFTYLNSKFSIVNCSASYEMKNESLNTMFIDIYLLKPKSRGGMQAGSQNPLIFNAASGDYVAATSYPSSPELAWTNAVAGMIGEAVQKNLNLTSSVQSQFLRPEHVKEFSQLFSWDKTTIVIEPGQVQTYFVAGPKVELDFSKRYSVTFLQNVQMHSRYPLLFCRNALAAGVSAGTSCWPTGAVGASNGVVSSVKYQFTMQMPEETVATTGGNGSNRHRVRFDYCDPAPGAGAIFNRDAEAPQVVIS